MEFKNKLCMSSEFVTPTDTELAAIQAEQYAVSSGNAASTAVPSRQILLTVYGLSRGQKTLARENTLAEVYININDIILLSGVERTYQLQSLTNAHRNPQLTQLGSTLILRASWTPPLPLSISSNNDIALLYRGIVMRQRQSPKPSSSVGQPLQPPGSESKVQFAFYTPPDGIRLYIVYPM
jgi:hypothetical protein